MSTRIIVSGIGTGGHYFPALVVAREFQARGNDVLFLARPGAADEVAARRAGLEVFTISPLAFSGKDLARKVQSLLAFAAATARMIALVHHPCVGMSFGGFGALPLIAACIIRRRTYYLFEANRLPGRATRCFSRRSRRTFLGIPTMIPIAGRTTLTGIPLRTEFRRPRATVLTDRTFQVLIIGGSQGARRLNEVGLDLAAQLPEPWRVVIVSGDRDYSSIMSRAGARTSVIRFSDEPWKDFASSDVIVSRSGALAAYEISVMGRGAVFVPFPFAVDDHQRHNAEYFARCTGAIVLDEAAVTPKVLADAVLRQAETTMRKESPLPTDAEKTIVDIVTADNHLPRVGDAGAPSC